MGLSGKMIVGKADWGLLHDLAFQRFDMGSLIAWGHKIVPIYPWRSQDGVSRSDAFQLNGL